MIAVSPIAFSIGGLTVRWYGIIVVLGMIAGITLAERIAARQGYKDDEILTLSLFMLPVGVIGARLYHVIVHWSHYADNIGAVFKIWEGGLAIHGGVMLASLCVIVYCRVRKLGCLQLLDTLMPGVLLGQAIGRWGNYFNQEAYGIPTDLPWGIDIGGVSHHPTFLYESLWNLAMFFVLLWLLKRKHPHGEIFGWYWILYSIGRFFIELIREDRMDIDVFGVILPYNSLFSLIAIAFGVIWIIVLRKTKPKVLIYNRK